jgi:hypothetical protein
MLLSSKPIGAVHEGKKSYQCPHCNSNFPMQYNGGTQYGQDKSESCELHEKYYNSIKVHTFLVPLLAHFLKISFLESKKKNIVWLI